MGEIHFHSEVSINTFNNIEGDQYNLSGKPDTSKIAHDTIAELSKLKAELTPSTSQSVDMISLKIEEKPDSKESVDILEKIGGGVLNILEVTKDKLIPIASFVFKHKEELSQVVNSATKMLP